MRADDFDRRLDDAWDEARSKGMIAESAARIREHAAGYIPAAWRLRPPRELIDIGSGAGVPGLHLADLLPTTQVSLLEASRRRCDVARTAVSAVGLTDRVSVVHARADDLARHDQWRASADAVVARLFGRPAELAECGVPLLADAGRLVVSVNAQTMAWWKLAPLAGLGASYEDSWTTPAGTYVAVAKNAATPDRYPRRRSARRRHPWPEG